MGCALCSLKKKNQISDPSEKRDKLDTRGDEEVAERPQSVRSSKEIDLNQSSQREGLLAATGQHSRHSTNKKINGGRDLPSTELSPHQEVSMRQLPQKTSIFEKMKKPKMVSKCNSPIVESRHPPKKSLIGERGGILGARNSKMVEKFVQVDFDLEAEIKRREEIIKRKLQSKYITFGKRSSKLVSSDKNVQKTPKNKNLGLAQNPAQIGLRRMSLGLTSAHDTKARLIAPLSRFQANSTPKRLVPSIAVVCEENTINEDFSPSKRSSHVTRSVNVSSIAIGNQQRENLLKIGNSSKRFKSGKNVISEAQSKEEDKNTSNVSGSELSKPRVPLLFEESFNEASRLIGEKSVSKFISFQKEPTPNPNEVSTDSVKLLNMLGGVGSPAQDPHHVHLNNVVQGDKAGVKPLQGTLLTIEEEKRMIRGPSQKSNGQIGAVGLDVLSLQKQYSIKSRSDRRGERARSRRLGTHSRGSDGLKLPSQAKFEKSEIEEDRQFRPLMSQKKYMSTSRSSSSNSESSHDNPRSAITGPKAKNKKTAFLRHSSSLAENTLSQYTKPFNNDHLSKRGRQGSPEATIKSDNMSIFSSMKKGQKNAKEAAESPLKRLKTDGIRRISLFKQVKDNNGNLINLRQVEHWESNRIMSVSPIKQRMTLRAEFGLKREEVEGGRKRRVFDGFRSGSVRARSRKNLVQDSGKHKTDILQKKQFDLK